MNLSSNFVLKLLSPRLITKALATIDKSTAIVVSTCWLAALVTLCLASYSVHAVVSMKVRAAEATVSEPVLPVIKTSAMTAADMRGVVERVQRQFPDIKFELDNSLGIVLKSEDGSKFHEWVIALSYIDAMAPQFRWNLKEMCVGRCNGTLMRAVVTGQRAIFALPEQ